jgi:hypothetical protein
MSTICTCDIDRPTSDGQTPSAETDVPNNNVENVGQTGEICFVQVCVQPSYPRSLKKGVYFAPAYRENHFLSFFFAKKFALIENMM